MSAAWEYRRLPQVTSAEPNNTDNVARITTMLTVDERMRIDAVSMGFIHAYHRELAEDVVRDLRERNARALVLSTAFCEHTDMTRVARIVREFPRIPAVALLSRLDSRTARAVLTLGLCGVRTLIDIREPTGWRELRAVLLSERASDIQRLAVALLMVDLNDAPNGARRFFEALFSVAPRTVTIKQLSDAMQVLPSTLMSRFFRAKMPPPKTYLAYARLTCAARLFENPGLSISSVANQLDYSSPQSFGRHVRGLLGLTAVAFRERYDGEGMLQRFRDDLIIPRMDQWRVFDPLGTTAEESRAAP